MRDTRSRTSAGPRRFMGGAAMSANRTALSLRTLSVSKTANTAGAAFTCDGSVLAEPEPTVPIAAAPKLPRWRSMSSVLLAVAIGCLQSEEIASTEEGAACEAHARLEDRLFQLGLRSDLNAARISATNSSGCSQAAKWVPFGSLL